MCALSECIFLEDEEDEEVVKEVIELAFDDVGQDVVYECNSVAVDGELEGEEERKLVPLPAFLGNSALVERCSPTLLSSQLTIHCHAVALVHNVLGTTTTSSRPACERRVMFRHNLMK